MAVVLLFHLAVFKAQLPQQLYPADLKPYDKVGVVDHAHLVGLGVAHAQPGLARDYFPVQVGFRFSRNAVMPSLKSAVCRMAALACTACAIWRSNRSRV